MTNKFKAKHEMNTMQDDRKLLERAAKAVGYVILTEKQKVRDDGGYGDQGLWINNVSSCWNPLVHNADAFELAAELRFCTVIVERLDDHVFYAAAGANGEFREDVINGDVAAAMRRAIVKAAAAISETM